MPQLSLRVICPAGETRTVDFDAELPVRSIIDKFVDDCGDDLYVVKSSRPLAEDAIIIDCELYDGDTVELRQRLAAGGGHGGWPALPLTLPHRFKLRNFQLLHQTYMVMALLGVLHYSAVFFSYSKSKGLSVEGTSRWGIHQYTTRKMRYESEPTMTAVY